MPRLDDLRRDILDETPEQLRERIRQIRQDRVLRKESTKVKKAKVKSEGKARDTLDKLISDMSPADLAALLKEMGE